METKTFDPEDGPNEVDDATIAFPGVNINKFLPARKDIPDEYHHNQGDSEMLQVVRDWFFKGIELTEVEAVDGIEPEKAVRHIAVCIKCYDPSHERKEEGCAYLLDTWFETFEYKIPEDDDG